MTELGFSIAGVKTDSEAAVPGLLFGLRIAASQPVHAMLLRVLVQIEPRRRRYTARESERMTDLFGEPERWADTLRPLVWARATLAVPAFEGSTEIELPASCTYDFEVAYARYVDALEDGEIPLLFLFSGTIFLKTEFGFQVQQVPWDKEAVFRLPVRAWREAVERRFPGCGWVRLRRESLDALERYRIRQGYLNCDEAIQALAKPIGEPLAGRHSGSGGEAVVMEPAVRSSGRGGEAAR